MVLLFSCNITPLGIRLFRRKVDSPHSDRRLPDGSSPFFLPLFVSLLFQDADGKNDVSKKSHINLVKYPDNLNQKGESHY